MTKQDEAFKKGLSINRETTLCGNNILKSVLRAKELGYLIDLRYVGVSDPEIAKRRVAKRISLGGHGVSEDSIERRFVSSAEGFVAVFKFCDRVSLYDNSGEVPVLVAYMINGKMIRTNYRFDWVEDLLGKI